MSDEKKCSQCGKLLKRKRTKGKLESLRDFRKRKFCNKTCSSLYQHSHKSVSESQKNKENIEKAEESIKNGGESGFKTGVQILREIANDTKLDAVTRMNAAGKLAPYETKKASEVRGKKEEQGNKAKKAATGKFSAGAAPVQRVK